LLQGTGCRVQGVSGIRDQGTELLLVTPATSNNIFLTKKTSPCPHSKGEFKKTSPYPPSKGE